MSELELKIICNSLVAYDNILWSLWLGCEVPKDFTSLKDLTLEEINRQRKICKKLFEKFSAEI